MSKILNKEEIQSIKENSEEFLKDETNTDIFQRVDCETSLDLIETIERLQISNSLLGEQLEDEIRNYHYINNELEKYHNMLEKLQFVKNSGMIGGAIYKFCPVCGNANIKGHKKDCELAKLLK